MLALLLGLCSSQNKLPCGIEFIRKGIHAKEPLYIQILCTNYEVHFVFDCMGKKDVAGKPSVCDENRMTTMGIAVYEITEILEFIFITSGLEYQVKIALGV